MTEATHDHKGFTVYLEGDEGHQGNVLAHTFVSRVNKLIAVFNKLERLHQETNAKKTDFEIVAADKRNPTTLTLKPVPRVRNYSPAPAMSWCIKQLEHINQGEEPDRRISSDVLRDIATMSAESTDKGHKKFWINGHTNPINFDEKFQVNALTLAQKRAVEEAPIAWHSGKSVGEVIGELKKVDDFEADNEVVLVPKTGAEYIRCTFPESMRDEIGNFVFKTVKVSGVLTYESHSPHPVSVMIRDGGVRLYPARSAEVSFRNLKGIFSGDKNRETPDWDSLLNV